jgi:hypothetical protein
MMKGPRPKRGPFQCVILKRPIGAINASCVRAEERSSSSEQTYWPGRILGTGLETIAFTSMMQTYRQEFAAKSFSKGMVDHAGKRRASDGATDGAALGL